MILLIISESKTKRSSCCSNKETGLLVQQRSGGPIILSADLGLLTVFLLEFCKKRYRFRVFYSERKAQGLYALRKRETKRSAPQIISSGTFRNVLELGEAPVYPDCLTAEQ